MKKSQNKLFNVASARLSKSKEYVNFCLISGKDDKKEFATICKKKEDCKFSKGKDGKFRKSKKLMEHNTSWLLYMLEEYGFIKKRIPMK